MANEVMDVRGVFHVPDKSISLYGYLSEENCVNYLVRKAHPRLDPSRARELWEEAHDAVTALRRDLREPVVSPIDGFDNYLEQVKSAPGFLQSLDGMPYSFVWVELDMLQVFQQEINLERVAKLRNVLGDPLTQEQLMGFCLPLKVHTEVVVTEDPCGKTVTTYDPNIYLALTQLDNGSGAFQVASRLPQIQVVRFQGRYFIKNGYHRAYMLRSLGYEHLPVLLLEASSWQHVGAEPPDSFFSYDLCVGDCPPTFADFQREGIGRQLNIRRQVKVIRIQEFFVTLDEFE